MNHRFLLLVCIAFYGSPSFAHVDKTLLIGLEANIQAKAIEHKVNLVEHCDKFYKNLSEIIATHCASPNVEKPENELASFIICRCARQFFLLLDEQNNRFMEMQYSKFAQIGSILERMDAEFKFYKKEMDAIVDEINHVNKAPSKTHAELEELSKNFSALLKKHAFPEEVIEHHTTHGQN
ncbi:MAG TPA: hypothetical protein VHO47_04450 [Candidatus Babeliales bacterium]|nr:hypothetical protein [Candidatus Babeliales bacterium]